MINLDLTKMSYEEFKSWCNDRASDGKWSMLEAMACLDVIKEIDNIKVKCLFNRKKKTIQAREAEWRKRNYKTLS